MRIPTFNLFVSTNSALFACFSGLFFFAGFIHTAWTNTLQSSGTKAFGGINADKHELEISGEINQWQNNIIAIGRRRGYSRPSCHTGTV